MLPSPPHRRAWREGHVECGGCGSRQCSCARRPPNRPARVVRPKEVKRDDSNVLTRCNTCASQVLLMEEKEGSKRRDRRDGGRGAEELIGRYKKKKEVREGKERRYIGDVQRRERKDTFNLPAFLSSPLSLLSLHCDSSRNSALTSAAVGISLKWRTQVRLGM